MAISNPTEKLRISHPDYVLLASIALLTFTGIIFVYSSSFATGIVQFNNANHFVIRQTIWVLVGSGLLLLGLSLDYRKLKKYALPLLLISIILLVLVLTLGETYNGAQRWLSFGTLNFQPSELAKLAVIIYLAAWLSAKAERIRSLQHSLVFVLMIGAMSLLLLLQPDLGTTVLILGIAFTMFWAAGAAFIQILTLGLTGSAAIFLLAIMEGYRLDRLFSFLSAEAEPLGRGFQTLQSLIALGNGGISGLGLGASRGKFFYIPESHTDGIFAIIGEELGLIATVAILILFASLMLRGYQIAQKSDTQFGFLLATGITTWIVLQALLNIGGITRVIPLTGLPIPLLSYGGSSLLSLMLAIGILANISRKQTLPLTKNEGTS